MVCRASKIQHSQGRLNYCGNCYVVIPNSLEIMEVVFLFIPKVTDPMRKRLFFLFFFLIQLTDVNFICSHLKTAFHTQENGDVS